MNALVTLSAQGAGRPVFLVHPVGGSVVCYLALARSLHRPCCAFQSPMPPGHASLPDLARRYAAEVESGEVVLGGWSLGGLVAFEMARHRNPALLVLIDAPAPGTARVDEDPLTAMAEDLAAMTGRPGDAARVLAAPPSERGRELWHLMRTQDPGMTEAEAADRVETFRRHDEGFRTYVPESGVDCPVLLIHATNSVEAWTPWLTGPLRVERAGTDHYGLLAPPAVERVAGLIEEVIP